MKNKKISQEEKEVLLTNFKRLKKIILYIFLVALIITSIVLYYFHSKNMNKLENILKEKRSEINKDIGIAN